MTYSTLMVHLELGRSNSALLHAALDFARPTEPVAAVAGGVRLGAIVPAVRCRTDAPRPSS